MPAKLPHLWAKREIVFTEAKHFGAKIVARVEDRTGQKLRQDRRDLKVMRERGTSGAKMPRSIDGSQKRGN